MQNFELSNELFAALIGVALTLLLGAIGWFINSSREHSKWKREQKLKTYSQIANLYYKILSESKELNDTRRARKNFTEELTRITDEMKELAPDLTEGERDQEKQNRFDTLHKEFKAYSKKTEEEDEIFNRTMTRLKNLNEELEATAGASHIIASPEVQRLLIDILQAGEKGTDGFQYLAEWDQDLWTRLITQTKTELGFTPLFVRIWNWLNTDMRRTHR